MDIQYSLIIPLSKLNQSLELKKNPITYNGFHYSYNHNI